MEKRANGRVIGATVNGTGSLVIRAERVGAVSGYFVPIVVVIAVITFVAWAAVGPEPAVAFAIINAWNKTGTLTLGTRSSCTFARPRVGTRRASFACPPASNAAANTPWPRRS